MICFELNKRGFLPGTQTSREKDQLEWESRELILQQRIVEYEEERDRILRAATITASSKTLGEGDVVMDLPDPNSSICEQLEFAIRKLTERTQYFVAQNSKIHSLELKIDDLKSSMQKAKADRGDVDSVIAELQLQLAESQTVYSNLQRVSGKVQEPVFTIVAHRAAR
jgi:hypothetical protein